MRQNAFVKELGHCCNTCERYDPMSGYCAKTDSLHHGYDFGDEGDEPCPKWKIANDLKQTMPKKKHEQIKLDFKKEEGK